MPSTTVVSGVQYSGIWTMQQVNAAVAANTWPVGSPQYLYGWGDNTNGQLGLGNTTYYYSPKVVGATATWSSIDNGKQFSLATKSDGTLWAWGQNNVGQLGLGNITYYSSPKQVGALTSWLTITASYSASFAIKNDGSIWSWGNNSIGQLGLGNITSYSSPKQIGSLYNWLKIARGIGGSNNGITLAIKTDGTMWSWGGNAQGQLGLGDTTSRSSPVQIGALTTWSNVEVGYANFTLATKTDGTLWSWGNNSAGKLGLGNTTNYSSPKQVGALTAWLNVAAGFYSSLAIKSNGTLWTWGTGATGQLGLGNITTYSSPMQVGALTNWLKASSGKEFTTVIKTDGTLWAWGDGAYGNLGLGNSTSYSSPMQVGASTNWISSSASFRFSMGIKGS